jgi:hypothetical protein
MSDQFHDFNSHWVHANATPNFINLEHMYSSSGSQRAMLVANMWLIALLSLMAFKLQSLKRSCSLQRGPILIELDFIVPHGCTSLKGVMINISWLTYQHQIWAHDWMDSNWVGSCCPSWLLSLCIYAVVHNGYSVTLMSTDPHCLSLRILDFCESE